METNNENVEFFREQFDAIAHEISRLAIACDIDLQTPDLADRILRNDSTVCGRSNPDAFEELRRTLMALYPLEVDAIDKLGAAETKVLLESIRMAIRELRSWR